MKVDGVYKVAGFSPAREGKKFVRRSIGKMEPPAEFFIRLHWVEAKSGVIHPFEFHRPVVSGYGCTVKHGLAEFPGYRIASGNESLLVGIGGFGYGRLNVVAQVNVS